MKYVCFPLLLCPGKLDNAKHPGLLPRSPTPWCQVQSLEDPVCIDPCSVSAAYPLVSLQIVVPHTELYEGAGLVPFWRHVQAIVVASVLGLQTYWVLWLHWGPLCLVYVAPKRCSIYAWGIEGGSCSIFSLGERTVSRSHLHMLKYWQHKQYKPEVRIGINCSLFAPCVLWGKTICLFIVYSL